MAHSAPPVLASTMWNGHQSGPDASHESERIVLSASKRLKTGIPQLDMILQGGLEVQCLTSLSAEPGAEMDNLVTSILAQHLLSSPVSYITAITALSATAVDLPKLYQHLSEALMRQGQDSETVQAEAMSILNRMEIIKAIDFVGLVDGIAEMRKKLERKRLRGAEAAVLPRFKSTISDSEDDEDDLLESERPQSARSKVEAAEDTPKQHLLLIAGLSELILAEPSTDKVSNQALVASTLQSVRQMTREFSLYTIVTTSTVEVSDGASVALPSIFSSCTVVPKCFNELQRFADLQILIHRVPLSVEDARMLHATQSANRHILVRLVSVVEVLLDKRGRRAERWVALSSGADGKLRAL